MIALTRQSIELSFVIAGLFLIGVGATLIMPLVFAWIGV